MGHQIGPSLVRRLLHHIGYSLEANRKVLEGSHPDRNDQCEHLNAASTAHLAADEPVIFVDTNNKELLGPFNNGGKELRPANSGRLTIPRIS